ncbi:hypothetical protein GCM10007383_11790 [Arenibacter certesii]|uniref:Uncharacterized protein n=1 Tax=Arenibacter certesii TaxID=228955 RepID=A0A918ISY2_9FLAO|nr:hypothetical protein GCM10007383_11790 [Arenibacter certesii]
MDIPIAQLGSLPPPVVYSKEVLFLNEKDIPNNTMAAMYTKKTIKSIIGKSIGQGML